MIVGKQSINFGTQLPVVCRAVVDIGLLGHICSKHAVSLANLQWSSYRQVSEITAHRPLKLHVAAMSEFDAEFIKASGLNLTSHSALQAQNTEHLTSSG